MIQAFLQDLRRPEYVHVLLNPVPVYGLAMGLIGTAIALLLRSRRAHVVGLSLIFLATATAWPVYELGQKSSDAVSVIADDDGRAWLKAHEHRAEKLIPLFYVLAILSATAIVVPLKIPRASLPLTLATVILGLAVFSAGAYIAQAGGKIRHREFRTTPPPVTPNDDSD
ncbi:MAG: hypothetical protein ACJ8M1_08950 [Chthoniobacterales bacterium]